MKKIYTVFILTLIATTTVRAQDHFMRDAASGGHETGANQIRIGYGIVTMPQFIELAGKGISAELTPGSYKDITLSSTGAIALSYTRDNYALIAWGGDLVYENVKTNYTWSDGSNANISSAYFSAMLRADLRYINSERFQLYSSLGAGAAMVRSNSSGQSKSNWSPAFQVSAIGFRYGNNVAFFGELGFGYRGVANGGISFRF